MKVNFANDDALDEMFPEQSSDNSGDALESIPTGDEDEVLNDNPAESITTENDTENDATDATTEVTNETTDGETTDAVGTNPEEGGEETDTTPEEDPEEILRKLLAEVDNATEEAKDAGKEVEEAVQNSSMSDQEKEDMLSKMREKDDMLSELQLRYKALEDKLTGTVSENENYRLDNLVNKKYMDKFQNDPEVQQYVTLKLKADSGDDSAKSMLTEFMKEQLKADGYDIEALVSEKKRAEKLGMSDQSSPSSTAQSESVYDENEDGDVIDNL